MLFSERHHYQPTIQDTPDIISSLPGETALSFNSIYDRLLFSMEEGDYGSYQTYLKLIFSQTEYKHDFENNVMSFVQALFKTENQTFIAFFMQKPYCETPHDYFGLMVLAFNNPEVIHEDIFELVLSQTLAQSDTQYYSNIIKASTVITHLPVFQWYDSRSLLDELTLLEKQIIAMGAITHDNIPFLEKFTQKHENLASYLLTTLVLKEKIDFSIVQHVYDCLIRLLPEFSDNTLKELTQTTYRLNNKDPEQTWGEGQKINLQDVKTFMRENILDNFSHDFEQFLLSQKLQNELQYKKEQPRLKI